MRRFSEDVDVETSHEPERHCQRYEDGPDRSNSSTVNLCKLRVVA